MIPVTKPLPAFGQTETIFVSRRAEGDPLGEMRELSRVVVLADVLTIENEPVAAGSTGTIVGVWDTRDTFDVEFDDAMSPATIEGALLRLA